MWHQPAAGTKTRSWSSVTAVFLLLMARFVAKRQLTAADTTSSLWTERNVSTQNTKSGLHAALSVATRGTSSRKATHATSVTSGTERNRSVALLKHIQTGNTSDRILFNGNNSQYNMRTSDTLSPVFSSTQHIDAMKSLLPVVMLSEVIGYVTSPGFDQNQRVPNKYDGSFTLSAANNESILINVAVLEIYSLECTDYMTICPLHERCERFYTRKAKGVLRAFVFRYSLQISFHSDRSQSCVGFKVMFAIVPKSEEPKQLRSKLFNCSVPSFHTFSPVFNCTRTMECEGGEDERDCKNDCGGLEDSIDLGMTCLKVVLNERGLSWIDAHKYCAGRGQKLATIENIDEFNLFVEFLRPGEKYSFFLLGARQKNRLKSVSTAALYKNIWQWVDGRTIFSVEIYETGRSCAMFYPWTARVGSVHCDVSFIDSKFACEYHKYEHIYNTTLAEVDSNMYTRPNEVHWNVSVIKCPLNHMSRDFLSCDFQANCGTSYAVTSCSANGVTMPMFLCQRNGSSVHYTLVCDHMQHCFDKSDEDFCEYPQCSSTSLKCDNGQCYGFQQMCDSKLDCSDGSDEKCDLTRHTIKTTLPPGIIFLDGRGNYRMEKVTDSDQCPPTHFLCPRGFCLPVYLRCNDIADCSGHEDEVGCDTYRCPGFYRCRGSKVCLHPHYVCDDVPQCPEQDDELLCDLVCPDECRCQGLAFVCTSKFSASSYISLRYLDASNTNMTLTDVRGNFRLIALRLSKCHIVSLPRGTTFPNLRELDLSWNKLHRVDMQYFHPLKNLRVVMLTGNPLVKLINFETGSAKSILERLDLSYTCLQEISGSELASSPEIKVLNVSWSKLTLIAENSFKKNPRLENLDLRGVHLRNIPKTLITHLRFLKVVYTENYKLCCEAILPHKFHLKNCHTRHDLLASCDDLLRSNTYRVCLWILALLSLVGNVFSVVARLYQHQQRAALGSFGVFVTNLSVADLFMGAYLAVIGTADLVYRGRYLWLDDEWKNSVACNLAGFLCLLSSETSAFIICLITLDRFLVLKFPFGRLHFGRRSALVASGAVWVVGIALAIIPLLPVTTHWEFYSQTGICVPLPFTIGDSFYGYNYSFGVSILLNLVLFLLIAVGQVVVYWAVRSNSMPSITNTQTRDVAIARRLLTVVVSDFLCWFPIGLLGLLAATGTPIPGDLNVAVAIFVLPINSALNPFLYTFNIIMEKRRKAHYEQLLKRLKLESHDQTTLMKSKARNALESVDKNVIIQHSGVDR